MPIIKREDVIAVMIDGAVVALDEVKDNEIKSKDQLLTESEFAEDEFVFCDRTGKRLR